MLPPVRNSGHGRCIGVERPGTTGQQYYAKPPVSGLSHSRPNDVSVLSRRDSVRIRQQIWVNPHKRLTEEQTTSVPTARRCFLSGSITRFPTQSICRAWRWRKGQRCLLGSLNCLQTLKNHGAVLDAYGVGTDRFLWVRHGAARGDFKFPPVPRAAEELADADQF